MKYSIVLLFCLSISCNLFGSSETSEVVHVSPIVPAEMVTATVARVSATSTTEPTLTPITPTTKPTVTKLPVVPTKTATPVATVVPTATPVKRQSFKVVWIKANETLGDIIIREYPLIYNGELWPLVDEIVLFNNNTESSCKVIYDRCEINTGQCVELPIELMQSE